MTGDPQVPITVENTAVPMVEATPGPGHLASTGADVYPMVGVGFALIVAGVVVVAMARQKGSRA
jgi:hypothetical protein